MAVKVRLAVAADVARVLELGRAMHSESRFRVYPFDAVKIEGTLRSLVDHPQTSCLFVAEHSTEGMVGMLAGIVFEYFFSDVRVAQDRFFYVAPRHRGSPAAMKLLVAFRRWAENRQVRELCINMSVDIDRERFDRFMRHLRFDLCGSNFVLPLAKAPPA